jgi:hypothetical protein
MKKHQSICEKLLPTDELEKLRNDARKLRHSYMARLRELVLNSFGDRQPSEAIVTLITNSVKY